MPRSVESSVVREDAGRTAAGTHAPPRPHHARADQPDFPLLPASRGFCLSLDKALAQFEVVLACLAPAEGQLELD